MTRSDGQRVVGAVRVRPPRVRDTTGRRAGFLTRPYQRFAIAGSDDLETAVLLLAVGLAVSQLAARARRLQAITVTDANHLGRLHDTARLAHSGTPEAVIGQVRQQLIEVLGLAGCRSR